MSFHEQAQESAVARLDALRVQFGVTEVDIRASQESGGNHRLLWSEFDDLREQLDDYQFSVKRFIFFGASQFIFSTPPEEAERLSEINAEVERRMEKLDREFQDYRSRLWEMEEEIRKGGLAAARNFTIR